MVLEKYYSAKYDRAFKEVMLKEKNKDLLKDLLEKILNVEISEITLLPTQKLSNNINIAEKTLDALLETNIGRIGIEVNSENNSYVHPRNMSYICNDYASYTLVGESYDEEVMIIQINLSYGLSKKISPLMEYMIRDKGGNLFVKNFKIIEINMEYYLNLWYSFSKEGTNKKLVDDNYLIIMLGLDKEDLEKLSKDYLKVNKFMKELNEVNNNPQFVRYMTDEEDKRKIHNSLLKEALDKGMKQGIEQGIEQGSKKEKIEIAKNLLDKNISEEIIIETTGLSKEDINNLKK